MKISTELPINFTNLFSVRGLSLKVTLSYSLKIKNFCGQTILYYIHERHIYYYTEFLDLNVFDSLFLKIKNDFDFLS